MKFKQLIVAGAIGVMSLAASAADQTVTFAAGASSVAFSSRGRLFDPVLSGGTDVITFAGLAAGAYSYSLSWVSFFVGNESFSLNGASGHVANLFGNTLVSFGSLRDTDVTPLVLTFSGTALPLLGSYQGTLSVSPVPEPSAFALMLAGLGALGFVVRRRRKGAHP